MKTFVLIARLPLIAAVFAGLVAAVPSFAKDKSSDKPVDLQVTVNVPPTWRPFLDEQISETFAYRLIDTFRQRGYKGNMVYVDPRDDKAKDVPTIEIFLSEWRLDRVGNAQCTFTASIKTAAGEKDLGLKTGTTMFWPQAGGRWGITRAYETADALDEAARNAQRDLYNAVAKSGLVSGFETRK